MPLSTIIKGKLSAVSSTKGGLTQIMIFGKGRVGGRGHAWTLIVIQGEGDLT